MTRKKAIFYIKELQKTYASMDKKVAEAVDMAIEALSAEPKIYGNEHNCVLTMFGECSYDRNGCGSCEVVDKIRKAINAEPKTGEWVLKEHLWECDQCGCRINRAKPLKGNIWNYNYCPNCGAIMKGCDSE